MVRNPPLPKSVGQRGKGEEKEGRKRKENNPPLPVRQAGLPLPGGGQKKEGIKKEK
ncbi:MAG: hypothetical protein O2951_10915 [Bacteroidetes bacterium]|nr:hypothetical protein [Bacteroidota bacterium]